VESFFSDTAHAAPVIGVTAIFLAITIIAVGCTVAVQWRKVRQGDAQAALKQEMIKRGMSADDIVRVIQAGTPETAPAQETKAQTYERLASEGWEHEDIMRVIQLRSEEQANSPERFVANS